MARRFVSWWPAAFVGGLAYGFSPFTAATANAHLFLLFQAVPPLMILFVDRFFRSKDSSPLWSGVAIGALLRRAVLHLDRGLRLAGRHDRHRGRPRRRATCCGQHVPFDRRRLADAGRMRGHRDRAGRRVRRLGGRGRAPSTSPGRPSRPVRSRASPPTRSASSSRPSISASRSAIPRSGDSLVALRDPNWHIVDRLPVRERVVRRGATADRPGCRRHRAAAQTARPLLLGHGRAGPDHVAWAPGCTSTGTAPESHSPSL